MEMDKKVHELINKQINNEFYSAYLYMSFADYYEEQGLSGYANWYMIQAAEERDHALILRKYLHDHGCKVTLEAIDRPDMEFASNLEPLEAGLNHEKFITDCIHTIYAAAGECKDYRTMRFLDWFVDEQSEEEVNAQDMLDKMKLFGGEAKNLYDLDKEYLSRTYRTPSMLSGE